MAFTWKPQERRRAHTLSTSLWPVMKIAAIQLPEQSKRNTSRKTGWGHWATMLDIVRPISQTWIPTRPRLRLHSHPIRHCADSWQGCAAIVQLGGGGSHVIDIARPSLCDVELYHSLCCAGVRSPEHMIGSRSVMLPEKLSRAQLQERVCSGESCRWVHQQLS